MTCLLLGQDEFVAEWVGQQLGIDDFGLCTAIGILNRNIVAGVVYNNFIQHNGTPISIEMSIASIDKSWCSRYNLITLFAYPFIQLNVKRVQATCQSNKWKTRAFLLRLGFTFEGIGRQAHPLGGDAAVFSMLKNECRWVHGKESSQGSRSSPDSKRANWH